MINIGAEDYNVLKQQYIKKYIRLELLDFQYNIVDELSGNMTKCSINVDSNSDLRRSCDLGFVVTTSTFDIKAGSKLWLDKFVRPYVGYENMRTGEIQWYNQGIYLVNNPQWSYNASTNEISMQALDLMSKLTGLRNGNLEGIPTKIAKDENVREAIIKTIELGGFTKYICEECKTNDGTIVPVPYDIEIDVGGTVYDILTGLRDIMPNYQIYFDINGVFHYEPIPLAYDDPVLIDDDLFNNVLISENINTDFESVKNYVEVLGHTWDVDYYSPSDKTTVSGGTITPTFADLKTLEDGTAIGITLPSDIDVSGGSGTLWPDGYTQLFYIQSTGTQYIDTGFKPSGNSGIVVDYQQVGTIPYQDPLFGARQSENQSAFAIWLSTNITYPQYGNVYYNTNPISIDNNTRLIYKLDKGVASCGDKTVSFGQSSFTGSYNLVLFSLNTAGTVDTRRARGKLYSCKIYDNDQIVRNFIPCKNPSGIVGLYDVVNSQFYSNAGTGEFIAGPEKVDLPSGYTQLEYIQSSGTQRINTNYNPTQNTRVLTKAYFNAISSSTTSYFFGAATSSKNAAYECGSANSKIGIVHNTTESQFTFPSTNPFTIDYNKNVIYFNGSQVGTFAASTFTSSHTLYIFDTNRNNAAYRPISAITLYSFKVYTNDVLQRDYVPCRNQSNEIGLYDVVNNIFYGNAGSGAFVAGQEVIMPPIQQDNKITINYLGSNDVVDIDDEPVQSLTKDTEWIFQYVSGPILPSGYTQLEYIQSSGSQYINTGIIPNQDTRIIIVVDWPITGASWLYGARIAAGNNSFGFLQVGGQYYRFDYANSMNELSVKPSGKFTIDANKNKCYINGDLVSTATYTTFSTPGSMYLFSSNNNGAAGTGASAKIYSCMIYDNNTLVRNFIPCKNNDGTVGLYDTMNSIFYQNAGSGTFTAGPDAEPEEDKGGPFWRFMGHQQAQAISYDNNPSSPFYVGDPIGSSSVGRIRIVLYGGEYDNIYSDDLAQQRADFEIYQRSRLNDSISMETIPIPWMDANIVVSHRFGQKQEPSKYIVKSFSVDYATGGTMTINAISWYPYYEESEVV